MKVNRSQSSTFIVVVTIIRLSLWCQGNAEIPQPQEQNQEDRDHVACATPAQFAAENFKNSFRSREIQEEPIDDSEMTRESRTSAFQKSFIKFVKEIYNNKNYALALSQDCSHLIELVELSNEMNLGPEMVYILIRHFYNKIKVCQLMDDIVILELLEALPALLERHFIAQDERADAYDLSYIKKQFENILLSKFTEHLPEFQTQPGNFISNVAHGLMLHYQKMMEAMKKEQEKNALRDRLRQVIFNFFDTALNKTMWGPQTYNNQPPAYENMWSSFIAISHQLGSLAHYGIIKHMDDLDALLWSLTHRFCWLLDIAGASFPMSFYEKIESDLDRGSVFFLEYKEQDEGITTKKETLEDALRKAKTLAYAYEQRGIISMPMTNT